jgi:hypothetical protein
MFTQEVVKKMIRARWERVFNISLQAGYVTPAPS